MTQDVKGRNIFELEGPSGNSIAGSLMALGEDPLGFFVKCDREGISSRFAWALRLRLPYASAVIKESMRLYPPVALLGRESVEDVEVCEYLLPKGCLVMISQWVMHRKETYFEDAEAFDPGHWLERDGKLLEKQLHRGVYFPFGDGPRICIGKGFAMMEAVLILCAIAQRYKVELVPEHKILPQPSITLRPETGIQVVLSVR